MADSSYVVMCTEQDIFNSFVIYSPALAMAISGKTSGITKSDITSNLSNFVIDNANICPTYYTVNNTDEHSINIRYKQNGQWVERQVYYNGKDGHMPRLIVNPVYVIDASAYINYARLNLIALPSVYVDTSRNANTKRINIIFRNVTINSANSKLIQAAVGNGPQEINPITVTPLTIVFEIPVLSGTYGFMFYMSEAISYNQQIINNYYHYKAYTTEGSFNIMTTNGIERKTFKNTSERFGGNIDRDTDDYKNVATYQMGTAIAVNGTVSSSGIDYTDVPNVIENINLYVTAIEFPRNTVYIYTNNNVGVSVILDGGLKSLVVSRLASYGKYTVPFEKRCTVLLQIEYDTTRYELDGSPTFEQKATDSSTPVNGSMTTIGNTYTLNRINRYAINEFSIRMKKTFSQASLTVYVYSMNVSVSIGSTVLLESAYITDEAQYTAGGSRSKKVTFDSEQNVTVTISNLPTDSKSYSFKSYTIKVGNNETVYSVVGSNVSSRSETVRIQSGKNVSIYISGSKSELVAIKLTKRNSENFTLKDYTNNSLQQLAWNSDYTIDLSKNPSANFDFRVTQPTNRYTSYYWTLSSDGTQIYSISTTTWQASSYASIGNSGEVSLQSGRNYTILFVAEVAFVPNKTVWFMCTTSDLNSLAISDVYGSSNFSGAKAKITSSNAFTFEHVTKSDINISIKLPDSLYKYSAIQIESIRSGLGSSGQIVSLDNASNVCKIFGKNSSNVINIELLLSDIGESYYGLSEATIVFSLVEIATNRVSVFPTTNQIKVSVKNYGASDYSNFYDKNVNQSPSEEIYTTDPRAVNNFDFKIESKNVSQYLQAKITYYNKVYGGTPSNQIRQSTLSLPLIVKNPSDSTSTFLNGVTTAQLWDSNEYASRINIEPVPNITEIILSKPIEDKTNGGHIVVSGHSGGAMNTVLADSYTNYSKYIVNTQNTTENTWNWMCFKVEFTESDYCDSVNVNLYGRKSDTNFDFTKTAEEDATAGNTDKLTESPLLLQNGDMILWQYDTITKIDSTNSKPSSVDNDKMKPTAYKRYRIDFEPTISNHGEFKILGFMHDFVELMETNVNGLWVTYAPWNQMTHYLPTIKGTYFYVIVLCQIGNTLYTPTILNSDPSKNTLLINNVAPMLNSPEGSLIDTSTHSAITSFYSIDYSTKQTMAGIEPVVNKFTTRIQNADTSFVGDWFEVFAIRCKVTGHLSDYIVGRYTPVSNPQYGIKAFNGVMFPGLFTLKRNGETVATSDGIGNLNSDSYGILPHLSLVYYINFYANTTLSSTYEASIELGSTFDLHVKAVGDDNSKYGDIVYTNDSGTISPDGNLVIGLFENPQIKGANITSLSNYLTVKAINYTHFDPDPNNFIFALHPGQFSASFYRITLQAADDAPVGSATNTLKLLLSNFAAQSATIKFMVTAPTTVMYANFMLDGNVFQTQITTETFLAVLVCDYHYAYTDVFDGMLVHKSGWPTTTLRSPTVLIKGASVAVRRQKTTGTNNYTYTISSMSVLEIGGIAGKDVTTGENQYDFTTTTEIETKAMGTPVKLCALKTYSTSYWRLYVVGMVIFPSTTNYAQQYYPTWTYTKYYTNNSV